MASATLCRVRFELRVKNWRSYIPILDVITHYRRSDFSRDLTSGLVVGVITIPQAIAYAFLAGLPAQAGLYACLVPMVIYAILGSSRHLVVGPVAVAALMVAAAVGEHAPLYNESYLGITAVLGLQAGIFLWLLRLWKMGGVVNLLSHPVIVGFVNAAALLIIVSQLNAFTGIADEGSKNPIDRLGQLVSKLGELHTTTTIIGVCCVVGLWLVRRWGVSVAELLVHPLGFSLGDRQLIARLGPLLVASVAVIVVWAGDLNGTAGVATIGLVPGGLPSLTVPPFNWDMWVDLAPSSAMIAVVAYVESFSIGTMIATRQRTRINAHQELIALGAANIGAAFTGAYPVAGSFSRSSVNYQTGARTPVSSLVCAAVIILTLLFFTPLFTYLPHAALAAIVIVSVTSLLDFRSFRTHWRIHREDSVTQMVTLASVLLFGVEAGLLTGVTLSIAFFIRQSSRPNVTLVGRMGDTEQFRSARRYPVKTFEHVAAVRVDENLYFGNANQVENKLLKVVHRRPATKHLVLVCSAINMIDVSGLEMLYRINQNLTDMGITLHLSEVKGPVMEQLAATDFISALAGTVYFTTDQAMRDLAPRT
ncbi:MAG TPA: sulfate permease [Pseudomonadales bacterium]